MGQEPRQKRKCLPAILAGLAVFASAASSQALKSDDDTLVEGAKLCTRYLPRHERQYGIPEHLLAAIASTESGRFHRALGLNLPWPWTINVEGQGHFYDTKEEAIEAVRSYQARGFTSIDVGCMQVNLHHHPGAFSSLEQAFDPAYNVAYAAQFLKQNFMEEGGSWRKATADYHSKTLAYGSPYANLVFNAWNRIIGKVADARAGRPILNVAAASRPAVTPVRVSGYRSVHMHSISLGRDTSRENGVIVVRPESSPEPLAVRQQARLNDDFILQPKPSKSAMQNAAAPERSAIAPEGAAAAKEPGHGPQIVKVRADGTVTNKGQFQPMARIIRAGADSVAASVSNEGGMTAGTKSPFIFNN